MSEQQLLAAIAANPSDEMRRLIYADWLEEHGDPWCDVFRRGNFCGVMGWEPYEPGQYRAYNIKHQGDIAFQWSRAPSLRRLCVVPDEVLHTDTVLMPAVTKQSLRQQAIAAVSHAFLVAWCRGWRPVEADYHGRLPVGAQSLGVLNPGGHDDLLPLWKPVVTIGRLAGNDIVLGNATVSSRHSKLSFDSGQWFIEDERSRPGTYVNGERVVGRERVASGSQVRIGQPCFTIEYTHTDAG